MIGEQVGSYRLIAKVGEGGMGVVYAGEHVELGHRVAIKILRAHFTSNPEIVQRFFNEARAATRVRHPGIVQIFDFGRFPDGTVYFVMELLEGDSLGDILERGTLPQPYAAAIARQVAGALGAAHAVKIVHRDLKPDNIVIVRDPEVAMGERAKILDFGIAKLIDMQVAASMKTQTGSVMGTPYYMSPEQSRGAGEIDHRSDVYSLGCILFEMVAGQPPFLSDGLGEVIGMHQFVAPPRPSAFNPEVGPELEAVILQTLAKKPEDRFPNMEALATALAPFTVGAAAILGPLPPRDPTGVLRGLGAMNAGPVTAALDTDSRSVKKELGGSESGAVKASAVSLPGMGSSPGLPPGASLTGTENPERRTTGVRPGSRPGAPAGSVTTLRDATGESLTTPPIILGRAKIPRGVWLGALAALVAVVTAGTVVVLAGRGKGEAAKAPPVTGAATSPDAAAVAVTPDAPTAIDDVEAEAVAAARTEVLLDEIERNRKRKQWRDVIELYDRLPTDGETRARASAARTSARSGFLSGQTTAVNKAVAAGDCAEAKNLANEITGLLPDDADAARLAEIAVACTPGGAPQPEEAEVEPLPREPIKPAVEPVKPAPEPAKPTPAKPTPAKPTPKPTPARPPVKPAPRPAPRPAPVPARVDATTAEATLRKGDAALALRMAEQVLARTPRDQLALTIAGLASCRANNAAKARKYLERLDGQRADAMRQICLRQGISLPGVAPADDLPDTPNTADATRTVNAVRGRLAACGVDYRATSTVRLRITIGTDGTVRAVSADAVPKVASCMEAIARTLRFQSSRRGLTLNYPVALR